LKSRFEGGVVAAQKAFFKKYPQMINEKLRLLWLRRFNATYPVTLVAKFRI